jgi:hypothetical protein
VLVRGVPIFLYLQLTSVQLTRKDPTGIFSDIGIQRTLTEVEVFYYTNCSVEVFTASGSVLIANTTFIAPLITLEFTTPPRALFITYTYPLVVLTSLKPSQTLTFVQPARNNSLNVGGNVCKLWQVFWRRILQVRNAMKYFDSLEWLFLFKHSECLR